MAGVGLCPELREGIYNNLQYLIRELDTKYLLLDHLLQENVLDDHDVERIKHEPTTQDKNIKLIDILKDKDDVAHLLFLKCLKKTQKHVYGCLVEKKSSDKVDGSLSAAMEGKAVVELALSLCVSVMYELVPDHEMPLHEIHRSCNVEIKKFGLTEVSSEEVIRAVEQTFPTATIEEYTLVKNKQKHKDPSLNSTIFGIQPRPKRKSKIKKEEAAVQVTKTSTVQSWSIEQVADWLRDISIDEAIILEFKQNDIDGEVLAVITEDHLKQVYPKITVGTKVTIILERDKLIGKATQHETDKSRIQGGTVGIRRRVHYRKFGSPPEPTCVYAKEGVLPSANDHPSDLLTPVHSYLFSDTEVLDKKKEKFLTQKKMMEFIGGCLNERRNGCLHLGVHSDGSIKGVSGTHEGWENMLKEGFDLFFKTDERRKVECCVRPVYLIPVKDPNRLADDVHIIEVDIIPSHSICKNSTFWVQQIEMVGESRRCKGFLPMVFNSENLEPIVPEDLGKLFECRSQIDAQRNARESQELVMNTKASDLKDKLRILLCNGEDSFGGDIYPILVLGQAESNLSDNEIEVFNFIKDVPWHAVFDFDSNERIFNYLEDKESQMFRVLSVEQFDKDSKLNRGDGGKVKQLINDMKAMEHTPWIFVNGRETANDSPFETLRWKRTRNKSFKDAVRYFQGSLPNSRSRVVVVFIVLSREYDIMLWAADELCTLFHDQWFSIVESDDVADGWLRGLVQKHIVDEHNLNDKTVVGIQWSHISATIKDLMNSTDEDEIEIVASSGGYVLLNKKTQNGWSDIEVLGAKQCEKDKNLVGELEFEVESKVQAQFYTGSKVEWLNFFFESHVLGRDCLPDLIRSVERLLVQISEDEKVVCYSLYHQPGAGGTTAARNVLWNLRAQYRCVMVNKLSNHTKDQIIQYYKYDDRNPAPLIILCDNLEEQRLSSFKAELENEAKMIARDMLPPERAQRFLFLLLLCKRQTTVPTDHGDHYHVLKQKLTKRELNWFRRKYADLEMEYRKSAQHGVNPQHLICLNIMKENFDPDYILNTVEQLLSEVDDARERQLLKYISLLNTYNIDFQALPASGFDGLMFPSKESAGKRWENHLSQPLTILLHQVNKQQAGQRIVIRVSHATMSQAILQVLTKNDPLGPISVCDIALDFLHSRIFYFDNNSVEELLKVVRNVVKHRAQNAQTGKKETKFAPLIQAVVDDYSQGVVKASEILQRVYEMSGDVFVGQQLARLFIFASKWDEAEKYAKEITEFVPDNSFLLDTYGYVFLVQMKATYDEWLERSGCIEIETGKGMLEMAFKAVATFQKEQEVSVREASTCGNCAGYLHELDTVVTLLDLLSMVEGLNDIQTLHDLLVKELCIPKLVEDQLGYDMIIDLRKLQNGARASLEHLQDEYLQLSYETLDDHMAYQRSCNMYMLASLTERLEYYYGEEGDEIPESFNEEQSCQYRQRRMFRLGANSSRHIFSLRKGGLDRLKKIKCLAEVNRKSEFRTSFDIQVLLSVNLTLSQIDKLKQTIDQEEMASLSNELYKQRESRNRSLEPFLFAAAFNWPRAGFQTFIQPQKIQCILNEWKDIYFAKYPQQCMRNPNKKKDAILMFLGKGEQMYGYCSDEELHEATKCEEFWRAPYVMQRLERWEGTLEDEGTSIRFDTQQSEMKVSIKIPTSSPIIQKLMWNKKVNYVIGFTWAGPKAYDCSLDDPLKHVTQETNKSVSRCPKQNTTSYTTVPITLLSNDIYKKELLKIRTSLRNINSLRKQEKKLSFEQEELAKEAKQKEEKLKQDRKFQYSQY